MLEQGRGGEDDLIRAFSEPAHIPQFMCYNQDMFREESYI